MFHITDTGTKPHTVRVKVDGFQIESAHGFLLSSHHDSPLQRGLKPKGIKVTVWHFVPTAVFNTATELTEELNSRVREGFQTVAVFHHDGPMDYKLTVTAEDEVKEAQSLVDAFHKNPKNVLELPGEVDGGLFCVKQVVN